MTYSTSRGRRLPQVVTLICGVLWASVGPWSSITAQADDDLPSLGKREKIRFFFTQWQHFGDGEVSDEELMESLRKVGATVFADWGANPNQAKLAHANGIRYFCSFATARMRGAAQRNKTRLAIDKTGKTCLERFENYVAAGGDPNKSWGSWGEGTGAYVPCPLDRLPWDEAIVNPVKQLARQGLADGLNIDQEPYGAYGFDQHGMMLCYCDDCFGRYLDHKNINAQVARQDRLSWLNERDELVPYLDQLRTRLIAMFREIGEELRAICPGFTFSSYPDLNFDDLSDNWRTQAVALGFNSPEAPFIVVNSVPYWENPDRPWWDSPASTYRRLGLLHVMGSWDVGIMLQHKESHVGAAQLNYELAMASDGFWRWGERQFDTDDWRMFALVNQRLRRMESRLGEFLFDGQDVPHLVTIVEQTGNPFYERATVVRTWEQGGRYLTRIFNGNSDWPMHVRVRFPRLHGETSAWRLRDPIHDVVYVAGTSGTWDAESLAEGLVVPIEGRGELFLLLEPAPANFTTSRHTSVHSMEFKTHRPRPDAFERLPEVEPAANVLPIVFSGSQAAGYSGTTASQMVTVIRQTDPSSDSTTTRWGLKGYCRQPRFSGDGRMIACSVYVNRRGQVYLMNASPGPARNISQNDACDRSPRFTPDGKQIVFVSDRDGDWEIYSMATDGSDVRRLTNSPGVDKAPAVSPDGHQIAFLSDRGEDLDLFLMNIDGSQQRRLIARNGNEYEPTWSPDSKRIACTVKRRNMRYIQLIDRDGNNPHLLTHDESTDFQSICFSPDGTQIAGAYCRFGQSGLAVLAVDDESASERDDEAPHQKEKLFQKLIVLDSIKPYPNERYSVGTASPRMIAKTFSGVSFSPDGKTLLYCSDQAADGLFRLYTIPAAGGESKAIAGTDSAWPVCTDWARQ